MLAGSELNFKNSIIYITSYMVEYDHSRPWLPPYAGSYCLGSGFVLSYRNKNFIITNSHVVKNSVHLEISFAASKCGDIFVAKVEFYEPDCDLALLSVADPRFYQHCQPLELYTMLPKLGDEISVVGFPKVSVGLSVNHGIISSIGMGKYSHNNSYLLLYETSAPINFGNSGGPALLHGEVIGVAFQAIDGEQNINHLIPNIILQKVLDGYLAPPYKGIPLLGIATQTLGNAASRAYFGMSHLQTGIRVKSIAPWSAAQGKLWVDDIILAINGTPISNDGKFFMAAQVMVDYQHLIYQQQNENKDLKIKLWRNGKICKKSVPLVYSRNVNPEYWQQPPAYYIVNHLVLMHTSNKDAKDIEADARYLDQVDRYDYANHGIIIANIFPCKYSCDHWQFVGETVVSINGQEIFNLDQAIRAIKNNSSNFHVIKTNLDNAIHLPKLTKEEQKAILSSYAINRLLSTKLHTAAKTINNVAERAKDISNHSNLSLLNQFSIQAMNYPDRLWQQLRTLNKYNKAPELTTVPKLLARKFFKS